MNTQPVFANENNEEYQSIYYIQNEIENINNLEVANVEQTVTEIFNYSFNKRLQLGSYSQIPVLYENENNINPVLYFNTDSNNNIWQVIYRLNNLQNAIVTFETHEDFLYIDYKLSSYENIPNIFIHTNNFGMLDILQYIYNIPQNENYTIFNNSDNPNFRIKNGYGISFMYGTRPVHILWENDILYISFEDFKNNFNHYTEFWISENDNELVLYKTLNISNFVDDNGYTGGTNVGGSDNNQNNSQDTFTENWINPPSLQGNEVSLFENSDIVWFANTRLTALLQSGITTEDINKAIEYLGGRVIGYIPIIREFTIEVPANDLDGLFDLSNYLMNNHSNIFDYVTIYTGLFEDATNSTRGRVPEGTPSPFHPVEPVTEEQRVGTQIIGLLFLTGLIYYRIILPFLILSTIIAITIKFIKNEYKYEKIVFKTLKILWLLFIIVIPSILYARTTNTPTNDPWWNNREWGLTAINAPLTWDIYGDEISNIRVGIVDDGIGVDSEINGLFNSHEDLTISFRNFRVHHGLRNHGQHVLGTIGATHNNGLGVTGVANLLPSYLFSYDAFGSFWWVHEDWRLAVSDRETRAGLVWNVERGTRIINFSIGWPKYVNVFGNTVTNVPVTVGQSTRLYRNTLQELLNQGHDFLIVHAAGNDTRNARLTGFWALIQEPNLRDRIITVGATDRNNKLVYFSNYGSIVDIVAPGYSIFSTLANRNGGYSQVGSGRGVYGYMDGTSMAAPHVTGVAALVWGANPNLTASEVKNIIVTASTREDRQIREHRNVTDRRNYYLIDSLSSVHMAVHGETARLRGTVLSDANNNFVRNSAITLESIFGDTVFTAFSDENGFFDINEIPLDRYRLTIRASGFITYEETLDLTNVKVLIDDFALEPFTGLININTASLEQLLTLPGIGITLANRIIEHRNTYGLFNTTEDLMNVHGIALMRYLGVASLITVDETLNIPNVRINLNTANSSQLQRLPGIGNVLANRIIAYRNTHGLFNTTNEITNVSGIGIHTYIKISNFIYVDSRNIFLPPTLRTIIVNEDFTIYENDFLDDFLEEQDITLNDIFEYINEFNEIIY
ncbi:MAG: S8 family serine peptidase [Defluviitaleaceae bacterium]|nr:S8 family serine peptidase [Defluviitaleaceae bacterium]